MTPVHILKGLHPRPMHLRCRLPERRFYQTPKERSPTSRHFTFPHAPDADVHPRVVGGWGLPFFVEQLYDRSSMMIRLQIPGERQIAQLKYLHTATSLMVMSEAFGVVLLADSCYSCWAEFN